MLAAVHQRLEQHRCLPVPRVRQPVEGDAAAATTASGLANLPSDKTEAARLGNHYNSADYMNKLEDGSVPLVILYDPDL